MIHISMHAIERQKQPRIHVLGLHYKCQVDFLQERGRNNPESMFWGYIITVRLTSIRREAETARILVVRLKYHCISAYALNPSLWATLSLPGRLPAGERQKQHGIHVLGLQYHCTVCIVTARSTLEGEGTADFESRFWVAFSPLDRLDTSNS